MTREPYEKPAMRYVGNVNRGMFMSDGKQLIPMDHQQRALYECGTCEGAVGPEMEGFSMLIVSTGFTERFCSNACLRAYVNRETARVVNPSQIVSIICTVGMVLAVAIALAL